MKSIQTFQKKKDHKNSLHKTLFNNLKEVIKWNKRGEIIYNGKTVKNSNIKHLIRHSFKNDKTKPVGYKTFYKLLASAHIPVHNKYIKM